jgi:hypothetical protein
MGSMKRTRGTWFKAASADASVVVLLVCYAASNDAISLRREGGPRQTRHFRDTKNVLGLGGQVALNLILFGFAKTL